MARVKRLLCAVLLCGLAPALVSCRETETAPRSGRPVIAVSIFPVANLVQQLAGDWAEVVTLLPADASPHDAEMTPDQVRHVHAADMLIVVGAGLDPWAERAALASGSSKLQVAKLADLVSAEAAGSNNHLWLDPVLTDEFIGKLAEQLAESYPAHAADIRRAAASLHADLKKLDDEYRQQLAAVPQKKLVTFHNAFDLIAQRYGLTIVTRLTDIELSPGGEVTPDKFREAIDAVNTYHLKTLYAEPEFSDRVIESLRRQTGAEVLVLDPQGNPNVAGYRSYQDMMRSNLSMLVQGQSEHSAKH